MLGVPETDSDLFIRWIHEILELGITDDVVLMQAIREMAGYFAGHIAERRDNLERRNRPKDDLISQLLEARIDGKLLDDQHLNGMLRLLLIAGIDTTWSGIGAALWHLARTPIDRDRLIAEPALMPMAIEEFLRAFSPNLRVRPISFAQFWRERRAEKHGAFRRATGGLHVAHPPYGYLVIPWGPNLAIRLFETTLYGKYTLANQASWNSRRREACPLLLPEPSRAPA